MRDATWVVAIPTTPWVLDALDRLAASGRFLGTREYVAEEVLRSALRELERQGALTKQPRRYAVAERAGGADEGRAT
jgi:hypothetical protein